MTKVVLQAVVEFVERLVHVFEGLAVGRARQPRAVALHLRQRIQHELDAVARAVVELEVVERRHAARRRPVWLRYVLVPGLTDNRDGIEQLAKFAAGLGNVQRVDVLPFHQLGKYKWARLKIPYTLPDVAPPDMSLVGRVCDVFRAEGLKAA